jgi:four helix bundle protein
MRIKICRKEAKESRYWLILTKPSDTLQEEKIGLLREITELTKIFNAIIGKST